MAKKNLKLIPSKGFTLIELLVVLGILGILAAALLAAINPVEQLRKGQDTSLKNVATEFVDASTSYFSTTNDFPWTAATPCYSGSMTAGVTLTTIANCTNTLVTSGELKASFKTVSNLNQVFVSYPDPLNTTNNGVVACFKPTSNAQQLDPNTKFTQNGNNGTACKSAGGATLCWWCAR